MFINFIGIFFLNFYIKLKKQNQWHIAAIPSLLLGEKILIQFYRCPSLTWYSRETSWITLWTNVLEEQMHVFLVLVRWNKDERRELNSSAPHINLSTRFHVRGGNTNSINNLASRLIWKKQNSGYEFTENSWLYTCVDSHLCYLMAVYTLSIYTKFMYENFCLLILQEARYDAAPHKFCICKIQVHSSTSELNATTSEKYKFTPKKASILYPCIKLRCIIMCLS